MRKTCSFDNVLKVLVLVALPVVFFLGTIWIGRYPVSLGEVLGCFKAFYTCDM